MLEVLKTKTILYVEDDPLLLQSIGEYLAHYFKQVFRCKSGEEALESYLKHRPDAAMLDINLPGIDGLEVAKKIREQDRAIKIVMLTAHTEKEKLLKATELNLTKYLVKPVSPKEFKASLQLLGKSFVGSSGDFMRLAQGCYLDKRDNTVLVEGKKVLLSQKAHRLLELLVQKKETPISYEEIMVHLWDDALDREISINSVKNQVSHLRKALPMLTIESIYGVGYIFR